jgi:hypothetical protein
MQWTELQTTISRKVTDNTMDKTTNNDLQNIAQKTKDRTARTPLTQGVNSSAPEVAVPVPQVAHVLLQTR